MSFEPQVDIGTLTKVSGILAVKDSEFIVVDRITDVTMQAQGTGLEAVVGNLVEIAGTVNPSAPVVAGASQLIDVTSIKRLTKGAAAAAGGLSIVATVAIVGGVAAAGTIGGLAAAHALPGQGSSPPSNSR